MRSERLGEALGGSGGRIDGVLWFRNRTLGNHSYALSSTVNGKQRGYRTRSIVNR